MTTIKHHPSELSLAAYVAGTLDEARSLVVASHISLCAKCQQDVKELEHIGGNLLTGIQPTPLHAGAWSSVIAQLGTAPAIPLLMARIQESAIKLPAPLTQYELGPWRWIGRGVHWRSVTVPIVDDIRVFMLRAAPGTHLPHHRHRGAEWTCVLDGAFKHDLGHFGPGDFDEADETMVHRPVVEEGVPCVCLVALQHDIELQSWLGRLVQPLIRL